MTVRREAGSVWGGGHSWRERCVGVTPICLRLFLAGTMPSFPPKLQTTSFMTRAHPNVGT